MREGINALEATVACVGIGIIAAVLGLKVVAGLMMILLVLVIFGYINS